VKKKWLEQG